MILFLPHRLEVETPLETLTCQNLKVRADLMLDLRKFIDERGWTQKEAADFFGETQPRISNLMNGEISRFSVDKLINMLARAGMEITLHVKPKAA